MTINSKILFKVMLLFYIFLSLGKIFIGSGDLPYGRYYCEKINVLIYQDNLEAIPLNQTNIFNRFIGDDNGRGIIVQNHIIGGLTHNYAITSVGGIFFSFFSSEPCYSTSTSANQNLNYFLSLFLLLIFVLILVKISNQKNLLHLTIFYLSLYFISFMFTNVFNRYYGLGLVDNLKNNFITYESKFAFMISIIEMVKSILLPGDSYAMWGIHPRNYALSLFFFALAGFILNKSIYSIYLINLSILFHLWSGLLFFFLYTTIIILSKQFLDHRKLLTQSLVLIAFLFLMPMTIPVGPTHLVFNLLIFTIVFSHFIKYKASPTTPLNINPINSKSKSILIISLLSLFYITNLMISIYLSLNMELMNYFEDFYMIRGFFAEAPQRLSPVFVPLLLISFFIFSYNFKKIKIL